MRRRPTYMNSILERGISRGWMGFLPSSIYKYIIHFFLLGIRNYSSNSFTIWFTLNLRVGVLMRNHFPVKINKACGNTWFRHLLRNVKTHGPHNWKRLNFLFFLSFFILLGRRKLLNYFFLWGQPLAEKKESQKQMESLPALTLRVLGSVVKSAIQTYSKRV